MDNDIKALNERIDRLVETINCERNYSHNLERIHNILNHITYENAQRNITIVRGLIDGTIGMSRGRLRYLESDEPVCLT